MNHQPFRDWLLTDENLSDAQTQALQNHLSSCESCSQLVSSWKEIETTFRKFPQVEPASGFALRWQAHLDEYQSTRKARMGWLTIGATGLIVICLLVLLITQLFSILHAPGPYLAIWLNNLVSLAGVYYLLHNLVLSNSWSFPLYTIVGMFLVVGFTSFMSVLWLTAYRKLSLARRVA
jgi:hypothetical protein